MEARNKTVKAIFQQEVRYEIPPFQRPYVWNQTDQWEPLWDDVRNVAERYLDELDGAEGNVALAQERTGTHFMGAVVLQQDPQPAAETDVRRVIDGQQRMTTLQVLLDATQESLEEMGFAKSASKMTQLVRNAFEEGDAAFKLWPTRLDVDAFRVAMLNEATTEDHADSRIVKAHAFFRLQIETWIQAVPADEQERRVHALETTLFGLLELVVIDLTTDDDAYVIFETLNARGTPLLQSELVKNYLFQITEAAEGKADLAAQQWEPLGDRWWRAEVRQGRLVRPRIDIFLNYWLVMRRRREVPSSDVFRAFKEHVEMEKLEPLEVAGDVRSTSESYRTIEEKGHIPEASDEGTFLYRWRTVDAGVLTPVLLWLYSEPVEPEARLRCLRALESFLVRRMICRTTTKDYNSLFLTLLRELDSNGADLASETVVQYLASQSADSREWPDDERLAEAVLTLPLYRLLTRGRTRMVLEAVEEHLRGPKTEADVITRGGLTIEHIMPQAWRQHWPLAPDHDDEQHAIERDHLVHTLGNLTLVNNKLNPALSNAAWGKKHPAISEHSVLFLNKDLLDRWPGELEIGSFMIKERGRWMADRLAEIWPAPAHRPRPDASEDDLANGVKTEGSARFMEVGQTLAPDQRRMQERLVVWAEQLESDGLVRLESYQKKAWSTLLCRRPSTGSGLVTVWNDDGRISLQVWKQSIERDAPTAFPKVAQHVDLEDVQSWTTVSDPSAALLDALSEAYKEAESA